MKHIRSFLLFAIPVALFVFSCRKENPPGPTGPTGPPAAGLIRFDSMAVGQISKYIGLTGEDYYTSNNDNYQYVDDTLVLEIVAQDANGFLVAESLHYVGDIYPWIGEHPDSVYHYYLEVKDDTLKAKKVPSPSQWPYPDSRIFSFRTAMNDGGLPLAQITSPKVDILGWKTSLGYCECRREAYTEDYTLFGVDYPPLNVIVENSAMAFDGNGETYVYSKETGVVRFSTYGWWTQSGYGWDLLP